VREATPPWFGLSSAPNVRQTSKSSKTRLPTLTNSKALSLGERVSCSGAFISRSVTGEGFLVRLAAAADR
jgi:hypothetical protein